MKKISRPIFWSEISLQWAADTKFRDARNFLLVGTTNRVNCRHCKSGRGWSAEPRAIYQDCQDDGATLTVACHRRTTFVLKCTAADQSLGPRPELSCALR